MENPPNPSPSPPFLSPYQALLKAGPRLHLLKQVHAHLITTNNHHTRSLPLPLLTKLATLAIASKAPTSSHYTRLLSLSTPNPDLYFLNTLIRTSSHLGLLHDAVFYYKRITAHPHLSPTTYTFTSLIKACADVEELKLGNCVHCSVVKNGYCSDSYVQASLVSFYGKCCEVADARTVFDEMSEKSVVAWNGMISGYERNGFGDKAVGLFREMRGVGVKGDVATFVGVVSACAQLGGLELGCWVHECVRECGVEVDVVLGSALIDMYGKCGSVAKAREVFDGMKERNVVAWTAMISGYGVHGYGREAVEMFDLMRSCGGGALPNEITFVAVLSACAHAGLVEEGKEIFSSMRRDYGLRPGVEHHVCMVDLLGRAGLLNEVFDYVSKLERPRPAVWTALVGACKMHKNFDMAVQAAEQLLALDPGNPGHYVMLSNVYALAGKMDRVEFVRNKMIKRRLKKRVGYSTIEIDQKTHLFSMGDKSHPETIAIYRYLDNLMGRISDAGYVPVQDSVLHELEEEERDYALRYHSEKLALAFGLLKTENSSAIRIVKNLRMCEDCHLAIKFISKVTSREIIVRDKLRFHHFKDGLCSCGDYW